ncbi:MAG TPA: ubiquinone/menaquinone biosynthesis methyltransferase [Actinomycetota bacterium]|nr:ubiquinone/menaquinone biosynthesis methyltransferase [Actinomycetota bacterium]
MARRVKPLPAGEEKARAVRGMFDAIAPRYDTVNRIMTFGMDRGWRRRAAATLGLDRGATVLDIACGTGDFCVEIERRGWRAIGLDFAGEMLARAKERGVPRLVHGDALALPVADGSVRGITCGFALRNVSDLGRLFDEMARVLEPGGRIALLETAEPRNVVLRAGHAVYFKRMVPLIGGLLSNRDAYAYLPRSIVYLPDPAEMLGMLERAGFTEVSRIAPGGGIVQILVGTRA